MAGKPPAAKRRITPQMVVSPVLTSENVAQPQFGGQRVFGEIPVREQSRISEQTLGPGRRLYVDLSADDTVTVSFRKLLKAQAAQLPSAREGANDGPSSSSGPKQSGAMTRSTVPGKTTATAFDSIIERIERTYVGKSDNHRAGSAEADSSASGGDLSSDEATRGGAGNEYDYDDDFIDDSEDIEYHMRMAQAPKPNGFFINQGDAGKDLQPSDDNGQPSIPPVKKRKRAKPSAGEDKVPKKRKEERIAAPSKPQTEKAHQGSKAAAAGRPDKDTGKAAPSTTPAKPAANGVASAPAAAVTATAPSMPQSLGMGSIAAMAAAAGMNASKSSPVVARRPVQQERAAAPAAPSALQAQQAEQGPAAAAAPTISVPATAESPDHPRVSPSPAASPSSRSLPADVMHAVTQLRSHVRDLQPPASDSRSKLPRSVSNQLVDMSCLLQRVQEPVSPQLLNMLSAFLHPFIDKAAVEEKLHSEAKQCISALAESKSALDASIAGQLAAAGSATTPLPFDSQLDKLCVAYARKWTKVHGGSIQGIGSQSLLTHLLSLWPAGRVTQQDLKAVLKRGRSNAGKVVGATKAKATKEVAQPASEAPASTSAPAAPARAASASEPSQAAARPASAGPLPGERTASTVSPPSQDDIRQQALQGGGDAALVDQSLQLLLQNGGKGLMVREIIDAANAQGFTGSTPWENGRPKRNAVGSLLSSSDDGFFGLVAKFTWAHLAFPKAKERADAYRAQVNLQKAQQEEKKVTVASGGVVSGGAMFTSKKLTNSTVHKLWQIKMVPENVFGA
ncbi:hypothetical protein WJX73_008829 [Symbiochloris irregularis]|uniref:Hpc2-related domain-containing protein n=1 Tax=Symbiochloris irregularis TaxID=706552 RepID=A0AAW1PSE5_9CHLO